MATVESLAQPGQEGVGAEGLRQELTPPIEPIFSCAILSENPKQKFDSFLNQIANHIFVTEATFTKRDKLRDLVKNHIVPNLEALGAFEVVCFPAGSVAVGMATERSDFDGMVAYSGDKEIKEMHAKNGIMAPDLDVLRFERKLEPEEFRRTIDRALHAEHADDPTVEWFAYVFSPSLNEFSDPHEKAVVDDWRRKTLQAIVSQYPDQAERIWDMIREYLESFLVKYEFLEGKNRLARVESAIQSKIGERFPDPGDKRRIRARSFIARLRDSAHYPSFAEMLTAYDIKRDNAK